MGVSNRMECWTRIYRTYSKVLLFRNYSVYDAFSSDNSTIRLGSSLNTRAHKLNHLWVSLIVWSVGHEFIVHIARFFCFETTLRTMPSRRTTVRSDWDHL